MENKVFKLTLAFIFTILSIIVYGQNVGQIEVRSDGNFYGWNGKTWCQLSNCGTLDIPVYEASRKVWVCQNGSCVSAISSSSNPIKSYRSKEACEGTVVPQNVVYQNGSTVATYPGNVVVSAQIQRNNSNVIPCTSDNNGNLGFYLSLNSANTYTCPNNVVHTEGNYDFQFTITPAKKKFRIKIRDFDTRNEEWIRDITPPAVQLIPILKSDGSGQSSFVQSSGPIVNVDPTNDNNNGWLEFCSATPISNLSFTVHKNRGAGISFIDFQFPNCDDNCND